jgi:hypothetical protein
VTLPGLMEGVATWRSGTLLGASVLAAVAAVGIATLSGVRHLRKLVSQVSQRDYRVVQLRRGEYDYR